MAAAKKGASEVSAGYPVIFTPVVAAAAWFVPGLGHLIIGQRTRGLIFLIAITVTFWGGVAIGGIRSTVDPNQRRAWFMAQICAGSHTLVALTWARQYELNDKEHSPYRAVWPSDDIAVVYTGVAGLLNLLVIFDVLGRLDGGGHAAGDKSAGRERGEAT